MLTSILDPAALALSAATLGTAAPAVYGMKINRLGRVLYGAGLGATGSRNVRSRSRGTWRPGSGWDRYCFGRTCRSRVWRVGYAFGKAHPLEKSFRKMEKNLEQPQSVEVLQGSAGAMHNPVVYSRSTATDKELQAVWKEQRPIAEDVTGQFDMIGQLSRSEHDGVAHVASLLMSNSSPKQDRDCPFRFGLGRTSQHIQHPSGADDPYQQRCV